MSIRFVARLPEARGWQRLPQPGLAFRHGPVGILAVAPCGGVAGLGSLALLRTVDSR
jgi:hypothetical protein